MKTFTQLVITFIGLFHCTLVSAKVPLWSLTNGAIVVCHDLQSSKQLPDFTGTNCSQKRLWDIDPQNKLLAIGIEFELNELQQRDDFPLALYLLAKASSRVYLNDVEVGNNGSPAFSAIDEKIGKLDSVFYLPVRLLKPEANQLTILMSSHNGYLKLSNPIHFIGLSSFGSPNQYVQQYSAFGLVLLGLFLISALYYAVLSFNRVQRKNAIWLFAMVATVAGQLFAEMSRGLFDYDYPIHDLRLLTITSLSFIFGISLLAFVSQKLSKESYLHWVYGGSFITLILIIFTPSFDLRTTMATIIPAILCTLIIANKLRQRVSVEYVGYLIVFILFIAITFITLNLFHEFLFYLLLASFLIYLFVQQAREFSQEQLKRELEQQLRAKLEYKLEQSQQQRNPKTININSAGKIERVLINDILYCRASGDYVELHLNNKRQLLFSGALKYIMEQLPNTFIKVHRSYLVNLSYVSSLSNENGKGLLHLSNQMQIPVSRRMIPTVRESLAEV